VQVATELSGEEDEGELDSTAVEAAPAAATVPAGSMPKKRDILSQEAIEKWCKDAKENNSLAAMERLMKVPP